MIKKPIKKKPIRKKATYKIMRDIVRNSVKKIKKQGGPPSEISNERKRNFNMVKDATKELNKLSKQFGKNK